MIWTETFDSYVTNKTEYYKCKKCGDFPAMTIESEMDENDYSGPYCRRHWEEEIYDYFDNLQHKLENEDWGSSPETRGEI